MLPVHTNRAQAFLTPTRIRSSAAMTATKPINTTLVIDFHPIDVCFFAALLAPVDG